MPYCHNPIHAIPCAQPCSACKADCDAIYLRAELGELEDTKTDKPCAHPSDKIEWRNGFEMTGNEVWFSGTCSCGKGVSEVYTSDGTIHEEAE